MMPFHLYMSIFSFCCWFYMKFFQHLNLYKYYRGSYVIVLNSELLEAHHRRTREKRQIRIDPSKLNFQPKDWSRRKIWFFCNNNCFNLFLKKDGMKIKLKKFPLIFFSIIRRFYEPVNFKFRSQIISLLFDKCKFWIFFSNIWEYLFYQKEA